LCRSNFTSGSDYVYTIEVELGSDTTTGSDTTPIRGTYADWTALTGGTPAQSPWNITVKSRNITNATRTYELSYRKPVKVSGPESLRTLLFCDERDFSSTFWDWKLNKGPDPSSTICQASKQPYLTNPNRVNKLFMVPKDGHFRLLSYRVDRIQLNFSLCESASTRICTLPKDGDAAKSLSSAGKQCPTICEDSVHECPPGSVTMGSCTAETATPSTMIPWSVTPHLEQGFYWYEIAFSFNAPEEFAYDITITVYDRDKTQALSPVRCPLVTALSNPLSRECGGRFVTYTRCMHR
jgi:hypothetical protein